VQQSGERQDKLEEQQRANAQQERELRKRIEALQAREYRAPKMDMMCKEQRQAVLLCYQTMRGAPAGEKVFKCQEAVDDLDRCATLVRRRRPGRRLHACFAAWVHRAEWAAAGSAALPGPSRIDPRGETRVLCGWCARVRLRARSRPRLRRQRLRLRRAIYALTEPAQ
jgi:hypothetical protein